MNRVLVLLMVALLGMQDLVKDYSTVQAIEINMETENSKSESKENKSKSELIEYEYDHLRFLNSALPSSNAILRGLNGFNDNYQSPSIPYLTPPPELLT